MNALVEIENMAKMLILAAAVASIAIFEVGGSSAAEAAQRVCHRSTYGTTYCGTPRYLRRVNKERGIGHRQTGGIRVY
jgi:hypothetical protein